MLRERIMKMIEKSFEEIQSEVRRLNYGSSTTTHEHSHWVMEEIPTSHILSFNGDDGKVTTLTVSAGVTEVDAFDDIYTVDTSIMLTTRKGVGLSEVITWFDMEAVELPDWLLDESRITFIDKQEE